MAKSIKGTQTEKNLLTSFAGESQARMRYISQVWLKRKVTNRFLLSSLKRLIRKKNMQNVCLSFWKVVWLKLLPAIRPV